jgi:hypothetical protein
VSAPHASHRGAVYHAPNNLTAQVGLGYGTIGRVCSAALRIGESQPQVQVGIIDLCQIDQIRLKPSSSNRLGLGARTIERLLLPDFQHPFVNIQHDVLTFIQGDCARRALESRLDLLREGKDLPLLRM